MSEHVQLMGGKIWLQFSLIFQMWAPFDIMVLGEISRSQRGLVIGLRPKQPAESTPLRH